MSLQASAELERRIELAKAQKALMLAARHEATLVAMAPADASEDDDVDERAVWLIAPIFDGETRTTSYVVLDGRRLSDGPVCEMHLPEGTFVPWGLHGCWQGA